MDTRSLTSICCCCFLQAYTRGACGESDSEEISRQVQSFECNGHPSTSWPWLIVLNLVFTSKRSHFAPLTLIYVISYLNHAHTYMQGLDNQGYTAMNFNQEQMVKRLTFKRSDISYKMSCQGSRLHDGGTLKGGENFFFFFFFFLTEKLTLHCCFFIHFFMKICLYMTSKCHYT